MKSYHLSTSPTDPPWTVDLIITAYVVLAGAYGRGLLACWEALLYVAELAGEEKELKETDNGGSMKNPKVKLLQRPSGIPVSQALATIQGKYTAIRRELGDAEDVKALESGCGYWLKITEPCKLDYGGITWEMAKGWNIIGWKT